LKLYLDTSDVCVYICHKKTFITLYIKYNKLTLLDIKLAITQHQLSRIWP